MVNKSSHSYSQCAVDMANERPDTNCWAINQNTHTLKRIAYNAIQINYPIIYLQLKKKIPMNYELSNGISITCSPTNYPN